MSLLLGRTKLAKIQTAISENQISKNKNHVLKFEIKNLQLKHYKCIEKMNTKDPSGDPSKLDFRPTPPLSAPLNIVLIIQTKYVKLNEI